MCVVGKRGPAARLVFNRFTSLFRFNTNASAVIEHDPHRPPLTAIRLEGLDVGADADALDDVSFQIEHADVRVLVAEVEANDDVDALFNHLVLEL